MMIMMMMILIIIIIIIIIISDGCGGKQIEMLKLAMITVNSCPTAVVEHSSFALSKQHSRLSRHFEAL